MKNGTVTIDTSELQRALKDYMAVSKKSLSEVINQKAFFMARGAARMSYRSNKGKIETELGKDVEAWREVKRGKNAGKLKRVGYSIKSTSLANNILRARIHAKNGKQPTKAEFLKTIKKFIAARVSSAAFLASGWIPAIKYFEARVKSKKGAPARDSSVKLRATKPMGGAIEAQPGWNPKAVLWNSAAAKRSKNAPAALNKVAGEALRSAMAEEVRSMRKHIADKLQGDANQHNTTKF